jgi:hypothetical protein
MDANENFHFHVGSNEIHHEHLVIGCLPNVEVRHSKLHTCQVTRPSCGTQARHVQDKQAILNPQFEKK